MDFCLACKPAQCNSAKEQVVAFGTALGFASMLCLCSAETTRLSEQEVVNHTAQLTKALFPRARCSVMSARVACVLQVRMHESLCTDWDRANAFHSIEFPNGARGNRSPPSKSTCGTRLCQVLREPTPAEHHGEQNLHKTQPPGP